MTTIKHPVRTCLIAAALGLIILMLCSRAYAADLCGVGGGSARHFSADIAAACAEPAAINNF